LTHVYNSRNLFENNGLDFQFSRCVYSNQLSIKIASGASFMKYSSMASRFHLFDRITLRITVVDEIGDAWYLLEDHNVTQCTHLSGNSTFSGIY
jgi:hypothetical protein